ncbi:E3 ubiquitin/ISG15 ligase TRIM25-like [Bombina bombina]|uniref:E3 ubiquitin/ISG15 ligase TRIM25-like n=1 Tax=Bombina bombina TaxID=8345 RepID=UPI00235A4C21|nr:E3 ubiquitin/ISG15 ligase TRIM25-like [Bombina bombina]
MASADVRETLHCLICTNLYTNPVTLSCGHSYCQECIQKTWDNQDEDEASCPECRRRFKRKPELQKNITLCKIVECILPSQNEVQKLGITCTYCTQSPVPATKSCLLCEASLCDIHLKVHSNLEDHILTAPTNLWGNHKCSIHKKLLEYYCSDDEVCICGSCSLFGEHRGHQVVRVNEALEKKKDKLRNVLQQLTSKMKKKTTEMIPSLHQHYREVQQKSADITERVITLFGDISEQLDKLKCQVLSEIAKQEKEILLQASHLIQQLEIEKDELIAAIRHIEELCNFTDPLTVLRNQKLHCIKEDKEMAVERACAVGDMDERLISENLCIGIFQIVNNVKAKEDFYLPEVSNILLDIQTAADYIDVKSDLKTAFWSYVRHRPETPERFKDYYQVLSTNSFAFGRHYWEVETSKLEGWRVGMCYSNIDRRGDQSRIGCNNMSWCLCKGEDFDIDNCTLSAVHDSQAVTLHHTSPCQRLGIMLDYETGRLSFYDLCDSVRHLYTFTATFTEPLYAAFCVHWSGWIKIRN